MLNLNIRQQLDRDRDKKLAKNDTVVLKNIIEPKKREDRDKNWRIFVTVLIKIYIYIESTLSTLISSLSIGLSMRMALLNGT